MFFLSPYKSLHAETEENDDRFRNVTWILIAVCCVNYTVKAQLMDNTEVILIVISGLGLENQYSGQLLELESCDSN